MAGKHDTIIGQNSFCRIFQTVRNLRKKTTGMSSKGPKMGEGRYGLVWNGRKTKKTGDPPWRLPQRSPARSGSVRRRLCKVGGRNRLPRLKPDWPENGSKRPSSGPRVLGNFSMVLKLKMSVLGLGFYLARKTRFI